jgi:hypothetical protein
LSGLIERVPKQDNISDGLVLFDPNEYVYGGCQGNVYGYDYIRCAHEHGNAFKILC